jgi:hypothetical protein
MRDATPDQKRLHWILTGLYVAFAVMFAWAGATSRWPFFLGSAIGMAAALAELRTRVPYPAHDENVHVVPSSWWSRRIPGLLGLPLVFFAFGAEYITHGNVPDGLGIAAGAGVFVAVMVWMKRNVVDRVEVTEDGLILRVLLGLRAVSVAWHDVVSVMDRGRDAELRVRGGKTYFLSQELSEFDGALRRLQDEELGYARRDHLESKRTKTTTGRAMPALINRRSTPATTTKPLPQFSVPFAGS